LSGLIVVVYEYRGVDHLADLVKLKFNVLMLFLLKCLDLLIKLVLLSLPLSIVPIAGAAINFIALAGPGSVDASAGADDAVAEDQMARSLAALVIADLFILGEAIEEGELCVLGIEYSSLISSLPHDLSDDLAGYLFLLLYLLQVDGAIFGRGMHDAELGVISDLADLPLLVAVKVLQEGLLLDRLEGLEFEDLSEHVVLGLRLQDVLLAGCGLAVSLILQMEQRIVGILGEVQLLKVGVLQLPFG